MKPLPLAALAVCSLLAWSAPAAEPRPRSAREIRAEMERYLQAAVEHERFTGSILVARDGRPILSRGYGLANAELNVPNQPRTVFRLASVTKQFTAAAILLLQERGRLSVHDPISRHLPDCPPAWEAITIRHCLTMTSGLPGLSAADIGALRGLPVPWDQWLEAMRKKPLEFTPGEKFKYANPGYTILGLIIERLSGKSYGEFLQENIFTPLGMKQTGYEDPRRIIPHRATGYSQLPGEPLANVPYAELFRLYAAGGIYSTTEDLLRWDQALYSERLLSRRSIEEMQTPVSEIYPGKRYGYGVWISLQSGREEIAHGGNLAGFLTYLSRFPKERLTVIVLSNNGKGSSGKISRALSAIAFGAPYELPRPRRAVDVPPAAVERVLGEYQALYPPTRFVFTRERGRLMVERTGDAKVEVFAEGEHRFFLKNEDIQFTFQNGPDGNVATMRVDQGDGTIYEFLETKKVP
ncbi:MAG: serine hydrolase [Verrucomicrobia bacterium]|nr:serine hydrolase [Verrucomicrobiota bacterium]